MNNHIMLEENVAKYEKAIIYFLCAVYAHANLMEFCLADEIYPEKCFLICKKAVTLNPM